MADSITPGMARTRLSSSSVSMVAPTILCRRSERRCAPVRAGLGVPRFPGRPPGTCCPSEDPDLIVDNVAPDPLVTPGQGLSSRKPEDLAGRSPDVDLFAVLIPISRHYFLHRHCLLVRAKKDVFYRLAVTLVP